MVTSGMSPLYSIPTSPTTHLPRMHPCLEMAKHKRPVRIHRVDDDGGDDDSNDDDAVEPAGSGNTFEYYTSLLKNYDEKLLTRKIYAKQTEQLQGWVKSLWDRWA